MSIRCWLVKFPSHNSVRSEQPSWIWILLHHICYCPWDHGRNTAESVAGRPGRPKWIDLETWRQFKGHISGVVLQCFVDVYWWLYSLIGAVCCLAVSSSPLCSVLDHVEWCCRTLQHWTWQIRDTIVTVFHSSLGNDLLYAQESFGYQVPRRQGVLDMSEVDADNIATTPTTTATTINNNNKSSHWTLVIHIDNLNDMRVSMAIFGDAGSLLEPPEWLRSSVLDEPIP